MGWLSLCPVGHNDMGQRAASVRRARRQGGAPLSGFILTWDVDSGDGSLCAKVRRFFYGYGTVVDGRAYRHAGFVEREGVRYLGQSVLFVTSERLAEVRTFLHANLVTHALFTATIGTPFPC